MPMQDADIEALANTIFGEVASEDYNTMHMVGSTAMNRLNANRPEEFGSTMEEVVNKPNAYYAVQNQNVPYKQALSKKFPDENSENKYKRAYAIASGLIKGTIEPMPGQFYFTPKEIKSLKKKGKKVFNFENVKPTGEVGKYKTFGY